MINRLWPKAKRTGNITSFELYKLPFRLRRESGKREGIEAWLACHYLYDFWMVRLTKVQVFFLQFRWFLKIAGSILIKCNENYIS